MSELFGVCRRWARRLLLLSLLLTVLRQSFDVIGRLWLPIIVNFLHILFIIFGLFGAWQHRPLHIVLSAFWLPFVLTWDVFLACHYLSVPPLSRHSNILSFGIPLSKSFFVERMPWCVYSYDYAVREWGRGEEECILDYYYVEVAIAAIHFLISFLAFDFMLILLCTFPARRLKTGRKKTVYERSQQQLVTDHIDLPRLPRGRSRSQSRPNRREVYEHRSTARARSVCSLGGPVRVSSSTLETTHDDLPPFSVVPAAHRSSMRSFKQYEQEPRGVIDASHKRSTNNDLNMSLISFDPKSTTLIRYHPPRPTLAEQPSNADSGVVTTDGRPITVHLTAPPLIDRTATATSIIRPPSYAQYNQLMSRANRVVPPLYSRVSGRGLGFDARSGGLPV